MDIDHAADRLRSRNPRAESRLSDDPRHRSTRQKHPDRGWRDDVCRDSVDATHDPHQGLRGKKHMGVRQIIFLVATFGFVTTLTWLAFSIVSQAQNKRRLIKIARPERSKAPRPEWHKRIVAAARPLAKLA